MLFVVRFTPKAEWLCCPSVWLYLPMFAEVPKDLWWFIITAEELLGWGFSRSFYFILSSLAHPWKVKWAGKIK